MRGQGRPLGDRRAHLCAGKSRGSHRALANRLPDHATGVRRRALRARSKWPHRGCDQPSSTQQTQLLDRRRAGRTARALAGDGARGPRKLVVGLERLASFSRRHAGAGTHAPGQNPARQAAMKAGIPEEKTAWSLNQVCGSGLRAVALGMLHVASGDTDVIVAGGQESMSLSPHAAHMRGGTKMGDVKFIDTMIKDGLWDAFHGYHMGTTAENVAQKWQISREDQDKFAVASQNKAEAAQTSGRFKDEIAPVTVQSRKGDIVVDQDEYIRPGTTLDAVAKLKPAFSKDGTVTAGNASGLNDGAAAFVIMSATEAS